MQDTMMQEIRGLAHDFAAGSLRPHVERWDHDAAIDAGTLDSVAELGFHGMLVPERYGGLGLGLSAWSAVIEALAWGEPSIALAILARASAATAVLELGSDAQKTRWLEALAGGVGAWLPLADGQAIRARRSGSEWRLEGSLGWVLRAGAAGCMLVPARMTDDRSQSGYAAQPDGLFLLPTDTPGLSATRETTLGLRAAVMGSISFDGILAGEEALLGQGATLAGAGPRLAVVTRLGIAATATGIARAGLEHALAYAAEREQFQQQLRAFEGIQVKLADMATRVEAASALLRAAATEPGARIVAMAKLFASEAATWVATQAVQIFGGYGYMRDYPVEKLMRDAKATELFTGTNEDLRVLITAELYRT